MTTAVRRAPSRLRSRALQVAFPPLREHQRALYDARQRFNVWVCHRRFGKTVLALYTLIADAYANRHARPRYGYLAPLYRQGKVIAWDLLKHLTRSLPGTKVNEAELRVDLLGDRRIQIFGADNPDALRGLYLDGAVFDEYAQMRPRVWAEVVRPALADRQGWATFIGTPMGHNHFYDLYQQAQQEAGWHTALYRASDTGIVQADELDSARGTMSPEQYAQEFECSWESALIGAYYAAYLETAQAEQRLTRVPHDPSLPVHTAWDLGISDATAIWFVQPVGTMLHVIDYLEASDHGLEWYIRALHAKPYTYGRHYFPHDIEARDFSSDGRTRLAMAENLGLRPAVVVPRGDVADGIQAVRTLFARFVFDQDKCHEGLEALKAYRREWSETRKAWTDKPLHDWCLMGDTPVLTRNGKYQIMDLSLTGEVLTSCGWKAYHSPRITRRNAPLVEVVFSDGFTVKCTAEHLFKTERGWISAQHLQTGSVIQSCLIPSRSILTAVSTACGRASAIYHVVATNCIAMCGKWFLGRDLLGATSITVMAMPATMPSATWNVCPAVNTSPLHGMHERISARATGLHPRLARVLRHGMPQRKDASGIDGTRRAVHRGPSGSVWSNPVLTVASLFWHWCGRAMRRSIVAKSAAMMRIRLVRNWNMPINMNPGHVSGAARSLRRLKNVVGMGKDIVAGRVIGGKRNDDAPSADKPNVLRVVQVTPLSERADVWCITVPGLEEFALGNGALVHNSSHGADALRTFATGYQETTPSRPRQTVPLLAGVPSDQQWMG